MTHTLVHQHRGGINLSQIITDDASLHVEVEGSGAPVTVFAHGLTNSCRELAAFTPMAPGTKVRFCFRGHGHSSVPDPGHYRFADFARDVDAVATTYGATCAFGTSLGAGAITHLVGERPDRFERLVFLLPAALDVPIVDHSMFDRTADLLEALPKDEAIEAILNDPGRAESYDVQPGLRELDMLLWQDMNPVGVARAVREVVRDVAVDDREKLREVTAPTLVIAREGDAVHPAAVGRIISDLMPNAELILLRSEEELFGSIPMLIQRVSAFLVDGA
jgi:3-oxoadipate enol-lactonase